MYAYTMREPKKVMAIGKSNWRTMCAQFRKLSLARATPKSGDKILHCESRLGRGLISDSDSDPDMGRTWL